MSEHSSRSHKLGKKPGAWLTMPRFLLALALFELLLLSSDQFAWIAFHQHKGWTIVYTIALVAVTMAAIAAWSVRQWLLRRPVQFNLASLLMLVVVVAIPIAWFAHHQRLMRLEALAAEWVKGRTGPKVYHTCWGDGIRCEVVMGSPVGNEFVYSAWRARASTEPNWLFDPPFVEGELKWVEFGDRFPTQHYTPTERRSRNRAEEKFDLTDDEVRQIGELFGLERLAISSRKMTDAGLLPVRRLRRLRHFYLNAPLVTPGAIVELQKQLPYCEIVVYADER